jgi:hypothetical protein
MTRDCRDRKRRFASRRCDVGDNDRRDDGIETRWHRLKTEHTGKWKMRCEERYDHNRRGGEREQFARPASEKRSSAAHDQHD